MSFMRSYFRLVLLALLLWATPVLCHAEAVVKAPSIAAVPATKPAQKQMSHKPPRQKLLVGYIGLVFIILVLTGLIMQVTLMLALRRAVLPRPDAKKLATPYVDAWALAGKRVSEKPPDDVTL